MYKYIFFDMDGTLIQSEFGVLNSVRYTLSEMGIDEQDEARLRSFIGPPLIDSFRENYDLSEEEAFKAVTIYREHYRTVELYNSPLYDGVKETARGLKDKGIVLYIVTAKPLEFARKIAEHFGLMEIFSDVIGPDLSIRSYTKTELIREAMNRSASGEADLKEFLMVGDRRFDIESANENGIDSVGVLYGYGSYAELKEAGATYIIEKIEELICIVK